MWLLQRKNLHKKHLLWLKIIGLCLSLHLIVLLWVFCIYRENKYMYAFSIDKKMDYSIPIIFLPQLRSATLGTPLKAETKTISPKVAAPKPPTSSFAKASDFARASSDTPADKPKTVAKPIKNELAKATTIATPGPKPVIKKQEEKPKNEETIPPIEAIKQVTPAKPVVQEKTEPTKKAVPVEAVKPMMPKKIESAAAQTVAEEQKQETPAAPIEKKLEEKKSSPGIEHPANAQVSNNFREVEALRRGAQLQKELTQKWQPPIGVSPDCTCDISFFVNKEGIIQNLKMVKSSGVMMFDISARQALCAMKMPQWTYGKPLIINFKQ